MSMKLHRFHREDKGCRHIYIDFTDRTNAVVVITQISKIRQNMDYLKTKSGHSGSVPRI